VEVERLRSVSQHRIVRSFSLKSDEAGQLTEFGVALGGDFDATTGPRVPVVVAVGAIVAVEINLKTDVAADLQAGFGARDVEVAGTECVANANVFHGLGFGS